MNSGLTLTELTAFAHDTRAYVRSIVVASQILLRRDGLDADVVQTLEKVIADAKQIDGLTTATVNYVCLAGASEATLRPTKLSTLLRGVQLEARGEVERAGGTFLLEGTLPDVLVPSGLAWVLRELVANSVKFSNSGRLQVTIRAEVEGDQLVVRVRDAGPGLPAERVIEAFTPYKTLNGHGARPGYGLGLPTAVRMAEICGGTLAAGRTGEGCEMVVRWPFSAPPGAEGPA